MRAWSAILVVGLTALASAARAQESICDPCIDVPANYQALKPLPTDWPPPSSRAYIPTASFDMGAIRSQLRAGSAVMRLRGLRESQLQRQLRLLIEAYESSRGVRPADEPADVTPPTANPDRTEEASP